MPITNDTLRLYVRLWWPAQDSSQFHFMCFYTAIWTSTGNEDGNDNLHDESFGGAFFTEESLTEGASKEPSGWEIMDDNWETWLDESGSGI